MCMHENDNLNSLFKHLQIFKQKVKFEMDIDTSDCEQVEIVNFTFHEYSNTYMNIDMMN